jgi:hypothetical protein
MRRFFEEIGFRYSSRSSEKNDEKHLRGKQVGLLDTLLILKCFFF